MGCLPCSCGGASIAWREVGKVRRSLLELHSTAPVQSLELHLFGLMACFELMVSRLPHSDCVFSADACSARPLRSRPWRAELS